MLVAALLWPLPAGANEPSTWADVQDPLSACQGSDLNPTDVVLNGDINAPSDTLMVECVARLDLNGHALTVWSVVITEGNQFTIKDDNGGGSLTADASTSYAAAGIRTTNSSLIIRGGVITAAGGEYAAGIGGAESSPGGTVTISDGEVTASGGYNGAGIGGGGGGDAGGDVTISGGIVTASGGEYAAGVGGAYAGSGATVTVDGGTVAATGGSGGAGVGGGTGGAGGQVTISGGTVKATGGAFAAGIGGGNGGAGGQVTIGAGAVVTAAGGHNAIGTGPNSASFGSLTVAGTLRLPAGYQRIQNGVVITVAATGQILGDAGSPTVGANFLGTGSIANGGVIALDAAHVRHNNVTVSGNHYQVAFDAAGGSPTPGAVTVFASSFEAGHRDFPTDPTRENHTFLGWTDQFHDPITADSALPGSSTAGAPVAITATANWRVAGNASTSTLTADPTSITANGTSTSTITVQAKDVNGDNLTAGGDTVTLATTAGTLSPTVTDNEDGTYTTTLTSATTAGTATVSGTLSTVDIVDNATVSFTAVPTPTPTPTEPEPDAPEPDSPDFEDVSEDSVHAEAVYRMRQYGITVGTSETTFDPSGDLPRSQMSMFLVRLLMLTDSSIEQPAEHEAAMALLVDKGLLLGDANGNLNGDGTLTRGQAASLLARLVEDVTGDVLTSSELELPDVATTHAHADNIAKLVEADVIHGYADGTFRSDAELRRDQMASLFSRTIDLLTASGAIEDLDA